MGRAPGSPHSKKLILPPPDRQPFSSCASTESTAACAVLKMLCETVNRLQAARTRKLTKELVVGKSPDLTGKHRSQPPAPEHVGRAKFTPQQEVHTPAVRTSTIFILRLNRKYRSACHFEDALQNSKPPSGGSDSQLRKIGCWKSSAHRQTPIAAARSRTCGPRQVHPTARSAYSRRPNINHFHPAPQPKVPFRVPF